MSFEYLCMCLCLDDIKEQNHSLFEEYRDPCRAGPGKEKPWVIGEGNDKPSDYIYKTNVGSLLVISFISIIRHSAGAAHAL